MTLTRNFENEMPESDSGTTISGFADSIRKCDVINPTCRLEPLYKMYVCLTIFLFRSGIAFYFHLFSTVQDTVRQKNKNKMCVVTFQKNP
jgi:hypothetical protein